MGSEEWGRFLNFIRTGNVDGYDLGSFWDNSWHTSGCDGAILWGGNAIAWDDTFPWWLRTQQFMTDVANEAPPAKIQLNLQ